MIAWEYHDLGGAAVAGKRKSQTIVFKKNVLESCYFQTLL